jgi:hypothetical protein
MKIPRSFLNSIFILSLAAGIFGLVLHGSTYFGIDPRTRIPITWYSFQLTTAFSLIPALISLFRRELPLGTLDGRPKKPYDRFRNVLGGVFAFFLIYTAVDFLLTGIVLLHEQSPEIVNGHYAMGAHGSSHPVTLAEFLKYSAYEARMHSSHWMAVWSMIAAELYDYLKEGGWRWVKSD